ncbi:MAG: PAS domain S-box protein [Dehalococcoidia bacterium]|nr:PAS domain S-box protein [Dehalococcoidia bacterium]
MGCSRLRTEDLEADNRQFARLLSGEINGYELEKRFLRRDGGVVQIWLTVGCMRHPDGTVRFAVASLEDVTGRRQMEGLMERSRRLELFGQIAGQVAHDFNNLLTPVMAYPELIRLQLPARHAALAYLNQIENAAGQMAAINKNLLTLSSRGHMSHAPLDLNGLVKRALGQMSSPTDTLVVQLELAPDLKPISASATQLVKVIANLLANAREAMLDAGTLKVKTGNVYQDQVRLGLDRVLVGK